MNDLINKFPNGQELYNESTIFNRVIHCIYHGMSLYEAISIFAEINEKQQKLLEESIMKMPMQPIMFKEE